MLPNITRNLKLNCTVYTASPAMTAAECLYNESCMKPWHLIYSDSMYFVYYVHVHVCAPNAAIRSEWLARESVDSVGIITSSSHWPAGLCHGGIHHWSHVKHCNNHTLPPCAQEPCKYNVYMYMYNISLVHTTVLAQFLVLSPAVQYWVLKLKSRDICAGVGTWLE